MGAIVAYKTDVAGNDAEKRQAGLRDLGSKILEKTAPAVGAAQVNYTAGLAAALQEIVNDSAHYKVAYEFSDDAGNPQSHKIKSVKPPAGNSDKIECKLDSNGADGSLKLHVRVDSRVGTDFKMDVVFPQLEDNNQYAYLDDAVVDIRALATPIQAKNYLAAFKLLSRCK
jgi:hypothetical protein